MWRVEFGYSQGKVIQEDEAFELENRLDAIDAFVAFNSLEGLMSVTIYVDTPDAMDAARIAQEQLRRLVDIPYPLAEITVQDERLAQERSPDPDAFDNLRSTAEVAEILGVQRQRVHQLRANPLFPDPAWEPAAGPFWHKDDIEEFLAKWERKPGRPRKAPKAS